MLHVPFKDAPSAVNAVIGGTVDVGYFALGNAIPQVKAGRLKPIVVIANSRSSALPEVPTLKESGLNFSWKPGLACLPPKAPRIASGRPGCRGDQDHQ